MTHNHYNPEDALTTLCASLRNDKRNIKRLLKILESKPCFCCVGASSDTPLLAPLV